MLNGRRQPSRGGTSRMMREYQVRFCETLGVQFPGPTRHSRQSQAGPLAHPCPQHPHTDRKFKARLFVAMCHKRP